MMRHALHRLAQIPSRLWARPEPTQPAFIFDSGECLMHIHEDLQDRQVDVAVCYEVHSQDCYGIQKLIKAKFHPEIIVDIGAHIGSFTALASKYFPYARIYSFEPVKQHYDVLVKNARRANCVVNHLAVLGFFRKEEGHEIYQSNEFEQAYRAGHLSNAISVEKMLKVFKLPRIDLLKIDCEEGEVNIFREFDFLNRLKDISVICGEWHFDTAKHEIRSIVGKTHHVKLVDEGQWNYFFAVHKEMDKSLWDAVCR